MYLVQILLPLDDKHGKRLPREFYERIKQDLITQFNGLTAYSRAPAEGLWKPRRGTKRDEIMVYEVMVSTLNLKWWRRYRTRLEKLLRQESIVIRAQETVIL